jgi:hypothetical protein
MARFAAGSGGRARGTVIFAREGRCPVRIEQWVKSKLSPAPARLRYKREKQVGARIVYFLPLALALSKAALFLCEQVNCSPIPNHPPVLSYSGKWQA